MPSLRTSKGLLLIILEISSSEAGVISPPLLNFLAHCTSGEQTVIENIFSIAVNSFKCQQLNSVPYFYIKLFLVETPAELVFFSESFTSVEAFAIIVVIFEKLSLTLVKYCGPIPCY